jgi:WD40 repeat protein
MALSKLPLVAIAATLCSHAFALAQTEYTLKGHTGWVAAVAFSPDNKVLATGGADNTIKLWDVATQKELRVLKKHTDVVTGLAFSSKLRALASASYDGRVIFWDCDKGEVIKEEDRKQGMLTSLAVNERQALLLATGSINGTALVNGGRGGQHVKHRAWVNSLAFNPDSKNVLLATGSSDNTVKTWQFDKGLFDHKQTFDNPEGEVRAVAFSPDGKLLAAGIRYGTIRVWDLDLSKEKESWRGHVSDVWSIAFAPDGKTLASGNGDWDQPGEVKLWDTTTWKQKGILKHSGEVLSLAYSPDGRYLAAGSWDQTVKLWDISVRQKK